MTTERYTNIELVEMVRLYAMSNNNLSLAVQMFSDMHPHSPTPSRRVMLAATQRLRDHRQFDVPTHAQGRGSAGLSADLQDQILDLPVAWPPRSPDLTPLDFYLWGDIKRIVYSEEITSRTQLREKIISAFEQVKTQTFVLLNLKNNLVRRANLCLQINAGHFEQLLRVT